MQEGKIEIKKSDTNIKTMYCGSFLKISLSYNLPELSWGLFLSQHWSKITKNAALKVFGS